MIILGFELGFYGLEFGCNFFNYCVFYYIKYVKEKQLNFLIMKKILLIFFIVEIKFFFSVC